MLETVVGFFGGAFVGWIFSLSEFKTTRKVWSEVLTGAGAGLLGGIGVQVFVNEGAEWSRLRILAAVVSATVVLAIMRFVKK